MDIWVDGYIMLINALATYVVIIQGSVMYINRCSTIECPLYRYKICDGINHHKNCYEYETWNNMSEQARDSIVVEIYNKSKILKEE